jgi:hypothetical protein
MQLEGAEYPLSVLGAVHCAKHRFDGFFRRWTAE